jgi:hypothetical protein
MVAMEHQLERTKTMGKTVQVTTTYSFSNGELEALLGLPGEITYTTPNNDGASFTVVETGKTIELLEN